MSETFVYFIQAGEHGPVKIGLATDPRDRLQSLQTGQHVVLSLLRSVPGDHKVERWFHHRFIGQRIRGEWFSFSDEMISTDYDPSWQTPDGEEQPLPHPAMTSEELRSTLRRIGLRQYHLASRLGLDPTTVNRWAIGKVEVPRYASEYLSLLQKYFDLLRQIA